MKIFKHHVDKVEDENKVHRKRKKHLYKLNHIPKVTKIQSNLTKIIIKNIKLETGNLKRHAN